MLKILATQPEGKGESIEIPLLVSMTTSARDVCQMCLQYLHLEEDVKCYNIAISRIDRKGSFSSYMLEYQSKDSPLDLS